MRALHVVLPTLAGLLLACAAASGGANTPGGAAVEPAVAPAVAPAVQADPSPLPPPRPGILGCVESRELKQYVLALDAHRQRARRVALTGLGAALDDRRGVFGATQALALDQNYEVDGKHFAVAAELAPHFEPRTELAKQGPVLRRIQERPRAHAVDVLVCGLSRCAAPPSEGPRVMVRPLVIELADGESWGGSLELAYDYWWARVRYHRHETCSPPA